MINFLFLEPTTEFLEAPTSTFPGIDTSVENNNSIYAQDGGYASGRPSQPTNVPETIQQSYDAQGGYSY